MNETQNRMLINLIIVTDEHNLLQEKDQSDKDYYKTKEDAYQSLMRFITLKGTYKWNNQ